MGYNHPSHSWESLSLVRKFPWNGLMTISQYGSLAKNNPNVDHHCGLIYPFYSGWLAHIMCHGQKLDQIICALVKTWYFMVIQHDIMGIISQVPSHSTSLLMVVYGGNYMVAFVVWPSPRFLGIIQFEGVYIYIAYKAYKYIYIIYIMYVPRNPRNYRTKSHV